MTSICKHRCLAALLVCFLSAANARTVPAHHPVRRTAPARAHATSSLSADSVNQATLRTLVKAGSSGAAVLRAQILLDRAHFSPGEIDASWGDNLRQAITAFQMARSIATSGVVDDATWTALNADTAPALVSYALTPGDVSGPFVKIPVSMEEKAQLPALGFQTALEEVAEKFHSSPALLQKLNPGKHCDKDGQELLVPNVAEPVPGKAAKVVVTGSTHTVQALDKDGKLLASYPASVGSEHDPLPIGEWKILGRTFNPEFHYNPDLFWDSKATDTKATIKGGPNNPVGVVWIELSKEHYGIHGTPEPSTIGKTQSHGCIRLTNWDAHELAQMVSAGTPLTIQQ